MNAAEAWRAVTSLIVEHDLPGNDLNIVVLNDGEVFIILAHVADRASLAAWLTAVDQNEWRTGISDTRYRGRHWSQVHGRIAGVRVQVSTPHVDDEESSSHEDIEEK